jgi:hypothetical protein
MDVNAFKTLVGTFVPARMYLVTASPARWTRLLSDLDIVISGHTPPATWKSHPGSMTVIDSRSTYLDVIPEFYVRHHSVDNDSPFIFAVMAGPDPNGDPYNEGVTAHVQAMYGVRAPASIAIFMTEEYGGHWHYDGEFWPIETDVG